jgi:hypothetical protein
MYLIFLISYILKLKSFYNFFFNQNQKISTLKKNLGWVFFSCITEVQNKILSLMYFLFILLPNQRGRPRISNVCLQSDYK